MPVSPSVTQKATGGNGTSGATSVSASPTLSGTSLVIAAIAALSTTTTVPAVSSVSASGLTFSKRAEQSYAFYSGTLGSLLSIWTAPCFGSFSGAVTATFTAGQMILGMVVFGVANAAASPFDPNAVLPVKGTNTAPVTESYSTTDANDLALVFGCVSDVNFPLPTGFTSIADFNQVGSGKQIDVAVGYETLSSAQSSVSLTGGHSADRNIMIIDALVGSTASGRILRPPLTGGLSQFGGNFQG